MSQEESEFGSGIVVCLAKFSEHMQNDMATNVARCNSWLIDRSKGGELRTYFESCIGIYGSAEKVLSNQIWMWMNGASDHFYDLDEKAPEKLKELASFTLMIGHGFNHDETWDGSTIESIQRLWREACIEVDEMLGVESDWGQW